MRLKLAFGALLTTVQFAPALAQSTPSAPVSADKAREMFAEADKDKDGALSLDEWKAMGRRERGFRMIDADKDGKVTPAEIRAAVEAYRARNK